MEAGSRFVAPVRYGDAVAVRTRVAWVKETTFRVEHELSVGDRRCAEGFEVRAWVARPEAPGARLRALAHPARGRREAAGSGFDFLTSPERRPGEWSGSRSLTAAC